MAKVWLWVLCAVAAPLLRAEVPELLNDALTSAARDSGRWAYTVTSLLKTDKGHVFESDTFRVDPSKPYAGQIEPILINGKPPTERQLQKYRDLGEKRERKKENGIEPPREKPILQTVGDLIVLERAVVSSEDGASVTYEVPLRKENNRRFPADKFRVLVRVNRTDRSLEHVSVRLLSPIRQELIFKTNSGDLEVDFTLPDPRYGKVPTAVHGIGSGSILFFPLSGTYDLTLTDIRHVTPYDERLGVQIGPLKALNF